MKVEKVSSKASSKGTRVIVHFNFPVTPDFSAHGRRCVYLRGNPPAAQAWKDVHHSYDSKTESEKAARAFIKLVNEMAAGGLEKELLEALAVTASMHAELKKEGT